MGPPFFLCSTGPLSLILIGKPWKRPLCVSLSAWDHGIGSDQIEKGRQGIGRSLRAYNSLKNLGHIHMTY